MSLEIVFSFCILLNIILFLMLEIKRTGEPINPWILFLAMALLDFFIPSLISSLSSNFETPIWVSSIYRQSLSMAQVIFYLAVLFWGLGFWLGSSRKVNSNQNFEFKPERAYTMLFVAIFIYLIGIALEIKDLEGFDNYLSTKLLRVRNVDYLFSLDPMTAFFIKISPVAMSVMYAVIGIFFYYRVSYNRKILWGIILPLLGWLICSTTFFRGTQISFFLMLALVEILRVKKESLFKINFINKTRLKIIFLGVGLFTAYGAIRNFFSSAEYGSPFTRLQALLFEFERLTSGPSLMGVASIYQYFPNEHSYLGGKTILDMILLVVPRFLWESKPKWYGIDEIAFTMNWPSSTQNAVTMPGELYANWGPLGIVLMVLFGVIFGYFYSLRNHMRYRFIYCVFIIPMVLNSFWMSFSGLMNAVLPVPMVALVLCFVLTKKESV